MSFLSYNNIVLQLIRTDSVTRDIRLSEDRSEYMWTDFTINVQCIYNPAATSYSIAGPAPGNLPMVTDTTIRHYLMQPRRALLFQEGGVNILEVPSSLPDQGAIDCELGPIPLFCNITRIASSRLFYINYSIKAAIYECPTGSFVSTIATSRYSRHEAIGEDFLSTMTVHGITVFRSNILNALSQNADQYRGYIVPVQLLGYKRTHISFNLRADGITLEWTATDVEQKQDIGNLDVFGSAGSVGITKMGLTYQAGAISKGAMGFTGPGSLVSVSCWAEGMKGSSTLSLIQFLFKAAWDKLINIFPIGIMSGCDLMEDVFNNHVKMSISYVIINGEGGPFQEATIPITGGVGIVIASLPNLGGANPGPPFSKGTRGTAAYELAVNAFATACFTQPDTVGQDQTASVIPPDAYAPSRPYGTSPSVTGFYSPGDPFPVYSKPSQAQQAKDAARGVYASKTLYKRADITSKLYKRKGVVPVPKASDGSSSGMGGSSSGAKSSISPSSSSGSSSPTLVNLQLFQETTVKTVSWVFERWGAVPEIPNPAVIQDYQSNYTLLSMTIQPTQIDLGPDGYTYIYRISGVYEYSFLSPIEDNDTIPFDIPPWANIDTSGQLAEILPGDFEDGMINNATV